MYFFLHFVHFAKYLFIHLLTEHTFIILNKCSSFWTWKKIVHVQCLLCNLVKERFSLYIIHSVTKIFIEYIKCAKNDDRHWINSDKQDRWGLRSYSENDSY